MSLEVGSRLGHYDVTALIGEGGHGARRIELGIRSLDRDGARWRRPSGEGPW